MISLCKIINEQYYCRSKAGFVCCQRFMKINQLLIFELKRAVKYCFTTNLKVSKTTYRGVWLEQVGVVFIPSSYQQWNAERTHSTGGKKTRQIQSKIATEYILPLKYKGDVSMSSVRISASLCIHTQTVCTPALQRPLSGQAGLWGLAPGTPGSTVVPTSGLVALRPCKDDKTHQFIWTWDAQ